MGYITKKKNVWQGWCDFEHCAGTCRPHINVWMEARSPRRPSVHWGLWHSRGWGCQMLFHTFIDLLADIIRLVCEQDPGGLFEDFDLHYRTGFAAPRSDSRLSRSELQVSLWYCFPLRNLLDDSISLAGIFIFFKFYFSGFMAPHHTGLTKDTIWDFCEQYKVYSCSFSVLQWL